MTLLPQMKDSTLEWQEAIFETLRYHSENHP